MGDRGVCEGVGGTELEAEYQQYDRNCDAEAETFPGGGEGERGGGWKTTCRPGRYPGHLQRGNFSNLITFYWTRRSAYCASSLNVNFQRNVYRNLVNYGRVGFISIVVGIAYIRLKSIAEEKKWQGKTVTG